MPTWLNAAAYAVVIGSWLALVLFYGWCYGYAARPPVPTRECDPMLV